METLKTCPNCYKPFLFEETSIYCEENNYGYCSETCYNEMLRMYLNLPIEVEQDSYFEPGKNMKLICLTCGFEGKHSQWLCNIINFFKTHWGIK